MKEVNTMKKLNNELMEIALISAITNNENLMVDWITENIAKHGKEKIKEVLQNAQMSKKLYNKLLEV
jgi:hypothetical protein